MIRVGVIFASTALAIGCGGKARGVDTYRADTQRMLDTRSADLKTCYDAALASDPAMAGTVKVSFVVAKKTGEVTDAKLDPATTAPAPLGQCVLQALAGLRLEPGDRNEGRATFEYAFSPPTS